MSHPVWSLKKVSVASFAECFQKHWPLELVAGNSGMGRFIREKSINRPALALTGYHKYFAFKRVQLFGAGEMGYLREQSYEAQKNILSQIIAHGIPCMVLSRGLAPTKAMLEVSNQEDVPLFRTRMNSKDFSTQATFLLESEFALRTSIHGTLIDIKGVGTLMCGKSGVGKSECALALVERGHSLVADDMTHIRRVGEHELVGSSAELSRGYMECRGIGIINVAELFGIRSVRLQKRIDLVITFIEWHPGMIENRTGLEEQKFNLLGLDVPHMEIAVRPGRDMARLVEAAALVEAAKLMGYDGAYGFNERLKSSLSEGG